MAKLRVEFDLDNDEFRRENGDVDMANTAHTLRMIATDVEYGGWGGAICDYNGNTVGKWSIEE